MRVRVRVRVSLEDDRRQLGRVRLRVRVRVRVRVSLEDDRRQLGRVRAGLDYYYYCYYCAPARS